MYVPWAVESGLVDGGVGRCGAVGQVVLASMWVLVGCVVKCDLVDYFVDLRAACGAVSTLVTSVAWFFGCVVGRCRLVHMYAPHLP